VNGRIDLEGLVALVLLLIFVVVLLRLLGVAL
jgi:hypothetical protein